MLTEGPLSEVNVHDDDSQHAKDQPSKSRKLHLEGCVRLGVCWKINGHC